MPPITPTKYEIYRLDTPVLLIHGTDDERVPIETSERFAAERPDIVQFQRFVEAGHVLSWNVDVARYESLLSDFLSDHLA